MRDVVSLEGWYLRGLVPLERWFLFREVVPLERWFLYCINHHTLTSAVFSCHITRAAAAAAFSIHPHVMVFKSQAHKQRY